MFESTTEIQNRSTKGFTLIELLVVVVIVGILAAVALPNFLGQSGKAKTTEASAAIDGTKTGQESYLNENGAYYVGGAIAAVPTVASDSLGGTLITGNGVTLSSMQASIQVNLDTSKFQNGAAPDGSKWALSTGGMLAAAQTATSNSDFAVVVDGGGAALTNTQIRGLAAGYQKSKAKIFLDANQST